MREALILLASIASFAATPIAAGATELATPAKPDQPSKAPAVSPQDASAVICKTHIPTGSRLGGTKECRTRQEWADIAYEYRKGVDHMQQQQIAPVSH